MPRLKMIENNERVMTSSSVRTSSRSSTASPSRHVVSPSRQSPSRLSTSRLSMTSPNVSLATLDNDAGSDYEPLFRSRWDDEAEMDKSLKILKRKQAASIRLRKMNDVYDRLLEGKLRLLDTNFSNVAKELTKETRHIKGEIDEIKTTPVQFPRIESAAPPSVSSRQASSINGRGHNDKVCQSCLFDPANTTARCRHFPCFFQ